MSQPGLEQQFAETFVKEFDASQPGDLVTNFEVLSLASLPQLVHYTQTAQIASAGPHLSHGRMAASLKTSCMESCQLVGEALATPSCVTRMSVRET